MKANLLAAAAVLATAASAAPVFAGTSEQQRGHFQVPYACSVSPVTSLMTVSGTTASGSGPNAFEQNSDTVYSLSAVAYSGPLGNNNVAYNGDIIFKAAAGSNIVANGSKGGGNDSTVQTGLRNESGSTDFSFTTSESAFRAGNYTMTATLSCAQHLD